MHHPAPAATAKGADAALFEHTIGHALSDTHRLLERALEGARQSLQKLEDQARTPGERHSLHDARQQLVRLAHIMAERYPAALRAAMAQDTLEQSKGTRSLFTVNFDELELMDEQQIHASVERARVREVLSEAVDAALAELNTLVSAAQGQASVQPESNPLRPQVFLQALQTVIGQMQVSDAVRRDWMMPLAQTLGSELRGFYSALTAQLQQAGIKPIGFAIRQADGRHAYVAVQAPGHSPGFAAEPAYAQTVATAPRPAAPAAPQATPAPPAAAAAAPEQEALLTLERLRRLLQGEFDDKTPANRLERFAEQFSATFEDPQHDALLQPPPDFDATVPAAFEALQEMQQVDRLVERLSQKQAAGRIPPAHSAGLGQALGQEVVALMVDNLAHDARLLAPVQEVVRALEPALMRLAVDDPRFFSDREHPARRLLQEITDRSLGYQSVQATGFESFLLALQVGLEPLTHAHAASKEGFETVLGLLQERWTEDAKQRERERAQAVQSLWHAEQRHLLASRMARQIQHLPAFARVPREIGAFLTGPWVQVLAQAQLNNAENRPDPGRYRELVDALLWSAQPDQTRKNPAQLARLVPKLLDRLRHGLASIDYPEAQLRDFLGSLMQLHSQALQGATSPEEAPLPAPPPAPAPPARPPAAPTVAIKPLGDEPWLAPTEAKASGFMEVDFAPSGPRKIDAPPAPAALDLPVGTWVDLRIGENWERTQLTWTGPHGTLFLFTAANGRSQSMTRRLLDRLMAQGTLRIVSGRAMVGEALDAVARAAMRNSVDSQY